MLPARHISVAIARPAAEVYAYAADPARLPEWAAGLSGAIRHEDGRWLADSPMGEIEVRMSAPNDYGVLDHDVVLPGGVVVTNPLRVVANGAGSEVVFTLFRRPEMSRADFEADAAAVAADLVTLKRVLEGGASSGTASGTAIRTAIGTAS